MKVTDLKGIGPKTAALFEKLGLFDVEDLLSYYPLHYDYYEQPRAVGAVVVGEKCAVTGILSHPVSVRPGGKATFYTTVIEDATGKLRLNWFNAPYVQPLLRRGLVFVFRGLVSRRGAELVMEHPEILTPSKYEGMAGTLVPIYGLTKGLSNNTVIKAVRQALDLLPKAEEYLPGDVVSGNLLPEPQAVPAIHFPANEDELFRAQKRLAFDELFIFVLAMRRLRQMSMEETNAFLLTPTWQTEEAIESLPYSLTGAQQRVWREIEEDLIGPHPMARLVQGDVGSGKTILAFLAMLLCAENACQSVLLAPTEVLARQHFEKL
ncbi:MAG: DEAD/DEAH box helicase, partial [Lachnospiraceae bacterium]